MIKKIRAIIIFLFCTAGVVMGVEDDAMQSFLRETEGRIAELLQKGIESKLEKQINVRGAGKELAQHVAKASFVTVGESEFRQYHLTEDKPFNYAYACNTGAFLVNREAIARLISQPVSTPLLREETSKLISDLAKGSGELIACLLMNDFKQYWHLASERTASERRDSRCHVHDADGRVNPVAIFGVYAEYLIRKQIPQGTPIGGLHEFAAQLAVAEPEYTVLAKEMKAHYPEDDHALLQMLGGEASWSAVWAMGAQCIQNLPNTDANSSKRQANRLNKLIKKLTGLKISDEQKHYLSTKYSFSKLNELAGGKVCFDTPEEVLEKEKSKAEEKRLQRVRRICGMHAEYLQLLKNNDVWYTEDEPDERLVKLVSTLQSELACDLVDKFVELLDILNTIQDTASAEEKIPALVYHLLRMREIARLREAMSMEVTFGKMMDRQRNKVQQFDNAYAIEKLKINNEALNTLSQILEKMKGLEYYNSEKLAALLEPLYWVSSGSSFMGPNSELWYETRRELEGLQLEYILRQAPSLR